MAQSISTLKAMIVADAHGLVDGLDLTKSEIRAAAKVARDAMTDFERFDAERLKASRMVAGGLLSPDAAGRHLEKFVPVATLAPQLGDYVNKASLASDASSRLSKDVTDMHKAFGTMPLVFDPVNAALQAGRMGWDMLGSAISKTVSVIEGRLTALDELGDAAERLGVSASSLSRLQIAAQLGDVDPALAETMLQKMLVSIGQSDKALDGLGLSVEKLKAMNADQAFGAIADAIGQIPDKAGRMAAIQDIFGKSGPEAASLVEHLRELMEQADATGAVVSDSLAGGAGDADDAMTRLSLSTQGFANALASISVGPLTSVLDTATELSKTQFFERLAGGTAGFAADMLGLPGAGLGLGLSEALVAERKKIAEEAGKAGKTIGDALKDAAPDMSGIHDAESFNKAEAAWRQDALRAIAEQDREEKRMAKEKADEDKRRRSEAWDEEMRRVDEAAKVLDGLKLPGEKITERMLDDLTALRMGGLDTPEAREALIRRASGDLLKIESGGGFGAPGADKGTRAAREAVLQAQHQAEQVGLLKRIEKRLADILAKDEIVVEEIGGR